MELKIIKDFQEWAKANGYNWSGSLDVWHAAYLKYGGNDKANYDNKIELMLISQLEQEKKEKQQIIKALKDLVNFCEKYYTVADEYDIAKQTSKAKKIINRRDKNL